MGRAAPEEGQTRDAGRALAPNAGRPGLSCVALRFLVDECLSPVLAREAHARGWEAHHVNWLGLTSADDPVLMRRVVEDGFVVVTNNREDFHALVNWAGLHPGLVVLMGQTDLEGRRRQFCAALEVMGCWDDAINKVIEVDPDGRVRVFELPPLD